MKIPSLSIGNKARLKTILYIAIPLILIIHFVFILTKPDEGLISYKAAIDQNKVLISGLKLGYLIDNISFIEVQSATATADNIDKSVELNTVDIYFQGDNVKVTAYADKGVYELQKILTATGNIKGKLNDMNFRSNDNGSIVYNYITGKGLIRDGVYAEQEGNNIYSDTAEFDSTSQFVYFTGNVSVEYKANSI